MNAAAVATFVGTLAVTGNPALALAAALAITIFTGGSERSKQYRVWTDRQGQGETSAAVGTAYIANLADAAAGIHPNSDQEYPPYHIDTVADFTDFRDAYDWARTVTKMVRFYRPGTGWITIATGI